jgi:methionyl aminopeptidase
VSRIIIKKPHQIEKIRVACKVTKEILDAVENEVKPGVSTEQINSFIHNMMLEKGAKPATLGYKGYPKSSCISINDVICHGIPSPYEYLKVGDIVNIDVTSIVDGYFGDSSRMYFVGGRGACSKDLQELVDHTYEALKKGIAEVAPRKHFGDIGAGIQEYIKSTGKGYGIVLEYTGHGVGCHFHEEPQVIHVGKRKTGAMMQPGMIFTIEPMINLGSHKTQLSKLDGWTVRTVDGKASAQWEHTILVTENGYEILT